MGLGNLGQQQFARCIMNCRNGDINLGLAPLMTLRSEVVANDELSSRGGTDEPTRSHLINLLNLCDRWRRRITHNPSALDLGKLIDKAINVDEVLDVGDKPFGGDDVQGMSSGVAPIVFALDGTDPDIPLNSQLVLKSPAAKIVLREIDIAITEWTRLNSRDRSSSITRFDSLRIYGVYQRMLGMLSAFCGDKNYVDVAQVLPSDEPLGPSSSHNRVGEPGTVPDASPTPAK